jgi:hypothetical protein
MTELLNLVLQAHGGIEPCRPLRFRPGFHTSVMLLRQNRAPFCDKRAPEHAPNEPARPQRLSLTEPAVGRSIFVCD